MRASAAALVNSPLSKSIEKYDAEMGVGYSSVRPKQNVLFLANPNVRQPLFVLHYMPSSDECSANIMFGRTLVGEQRLLLDHLPSGLASGVDARLFGCSLAWLPPPAIN